MLAVETPQPLARKLSIFRRFGRRERNQTPSSTLPLQPIGEDFPPSPRKLQRRSSEAPALLPTPPTSPKQHAVTFTEPQKPQKPQMITHIQRIGVPTKYQTLHEPPKQHVSKDLPLRVLPTDMPTTPFPNNPQIRPWDVFLPPSQIFSLYLGSLPRDTSDEWFIYSEGPDQAGKLKVHFFRSWTGMKIAELFVVMDVKGEGAGKIVGLKWNGSSETNRMNENEAKYMIRMSCRWTLGVDLEHGK